MSVLVLSISLVGCGKLDKAIVATGPKNVTVISEPDCSFHDSTKVITELNVGDTAIALSYEYPKDCMIYEIKLKDGRKGWVTIGDNCEVIDLESR